MTLCALLISSCLCSAGGSPPQRARKAYSCVDLGTLGGKVCVAYGSNSKGQIVGMATNAAGKFCAFLWERRRISEIPPPIGHTDATAGSINNSGHMVVEADLSAVFLYADGRPQDIGSLNGSHETLIGFPGRFLTDDDRIVGASRVSLHDYHAFWWKSSKMHDLGTLGGGSSDALAINDQGQIVGEADLKAGPTHACLWHGGRATDLGVLAGYQDSSAVAINSRGEVVGYSTRSRPFGRRACLWLHGKIRDLGTLPGYKDSTATSINDKLQIVGYVTIPGKRRRPFLWQNGKMTDLSSIVHWRHGPLLVTAVSIDNTGQILCVGGINKETHSFLLIPPTIAETAVSAASS